MKLGNITDPGASEAGMEVFHEGDWFKGSQFQIGTLMGNFWLAKQAR